MKRRKPKSSEEKPASADATQAPLQPAYFDAEADAATEDTAAEAQTAEPVSDHAAEPESAAPEQTEGGSGQASDGPLRRRRRRGRGGRGRGRSQASAQPAAPVGTASDTSESPAPASAGASKAPAAAAAQASKGTVVLAIGLPGSGKSSWFKRHDISPLSSDLLRTLLFDDATEQRFQDLVFSNLRSMLKARLIARRPMNYVDATNLSPHDRHTWIKMAKDYGYEVHAVFFDVPVEVCIERNQRRERNVPEDVMRRMAGKLKAPTFEEGFAKITVVRVKKKE